MCITVASRPLCPQKDKAETLGRPLTPREKGEENEENNQKVLHTEPRGSGPVEEESEESLPQ